MMINLLVAAIAMSAANPIEQTLVERDVAIDNEINAIADVKTLQARASAFRKEFSARVGYDSLNRSPRSVKVTGRKNFGDFRVEKLLFESAPGCYVTGLLYLPDEGKFKPPYAAYLFSPGHSDPGKAAEDYIASCVLGARNGLAALAIDPIGQGERLQFTNVETEHRKCAEEHSRIGYYAMLLGKTTMNYMLRDAAAALDVLASRPDIDANRLAAAGCSGGATLTTFLSVVEPRLKAVAPCCYVSSVRESLLSCGPQDCEQNFHNWGSFGFNHAMMVLSNERPFLISAAQEDFFPIAGTLSTYAIVTNVAARCGLPADRFALHVVPGKHAIPKASREAIVAFFLRHLNGVTASVSEREVPKFSEEDCRVTPEGSVLKLPNARSIYAEIEAELEKRGELFAKGELKGAKRVAIGPFVVNAERRGWRGYCISNGEAWAQECYLAGLVDPSKFDPRPFLPRLHNCARMSPTEFFQREAAFTGDSHVSFQYGGKWFVCDKPVSETELPGGKGWTSKRYEYRTPDGLLGVRVTWKFYTDYPAAEYLPELYATGDKPTKIVEKYASFALRRKFAGKNPYDEKSLRIRAIVGDRIHRSQFMPETHWLHEGGVVAFGAVGRSSDAARHFRMTDRSAIGVEPLTDMLWRGDPMRDDHMPYLCFDFPEGGGLDLAIGWSGSWRCDCTKFQGLTELKAGLMSSHFKVLPGETLRTPSIVLLRRAADVTPRAFRTVKHRFIRAFKSPRDAEGKLFKPLMPLTSDGGMKTDQMMIDIIKWAMDNKLCRDGFWIDAGWNGYAKKVDPLDWSQWRDYHGSWVPNRIIHPDGNFKRVSAAAHAAGMKFILWCEPERLRPDSDLAKSLPEEAMLTWKERPGSVSWATGQQSFKLLNLGHPKGCEAAISTLSRLIDDSNIDVYRQDCNIEYFAQYWDGNDTPDRRGITEMKHIAGLYRFWDTLRAKYPNLLIDNCASGGRRLDVELNSRSHCYCRSDYYISYYGEDQLSSAQNATLNTLDIQPFQGSESTPAKFGDDYGLFSATGPALVFTPGLRGYYSKEGITPAHLKWLQKMFPVCDRMRTYFQGDFYPQTEPTGLDRDVWCAYQMHRPDLNAGFVMAFRRPEAPNDTLAVDLGGIDPNATYALENWDGTPLGKLRGAEFKTRPVRIAKKRDFSLVFYRRD